MTKQLQLGNITVDVILKDIKNVHLSVYPPGGRVRISAPQRMDMDTIRVFAISKLAWIKEQQKKLQDQARETQREYLDRESHYVWGERYLLKVIESNAPAVITLKHRQIQLHIRPGTDDEKKQRLMESWYREQIKQTVVSVIAKWEPILGAKVKRVFVQHMKTKWGSCNPDKGHIRLNTELAKKSKECLEYIVLHEMVHLLEKHHNARFIAYMDRLMPQWLVYKVELNRTPLVHEDWSY